MATFDLWWQHGHWKHWTYLLCLQESGQTGECGHVSVRTQLTVCCVLSLSLYRKLWSRDKSPTEWGRGAAPHRVEIPGPCSSAPLGAPLWPGQDPGPGDCWPLSVPSSPPGHPSPAHTGHWSPGLTCVTLTGDWAGAGARNEIIIDVITISGVNIATRINSSEALNWIRCWGEAI